MLRQTFYCTAALAVLCAAPTAAHGQEPKPVTIREATLADGGGTLLGLAWRYRAGDDARWADPAFDDGGWEFVEPLLWRFGRQPSDGWQGSGWFRRHLQVEPELWGKPLAIRIESPGETAVFLDGKLLMSTTASGLRAGGRLRGGAWREVVFSPRRDHVLAVRHILSPAGRHARSRNLGFRLSIEKTDAAALQMFAERLPTILLAVFTTVPAFLTLLHLALFFSYPKARENLFYALTMVAFAAIVVFDLGLARTTGSALAVRLTASSILATIFFFLLTYYAVRTRAFPRLWIAFAAMAVVLILWIFLSPDLPSQWGWFAYFGLMTVEVIRVEAAGDKVEREGVKILLRGFALMALIILLQILMQLGLIPPLGGEIRLYLIALLVVAVAMSIFLAQSFARTSLLLERRLEEVRSLSEQVLAQERAAHEQELHRRLLEVENARQTSEIEEARALQLSMLPAKLPVVEGLETAAAMATASEVGGDYYDFRIASDGSLVLAFGDATGHGVAAGIMVTAVKALFSTLGGGGSLSAVLAECGRVLRDMHVKPLHMCLALARLTPRSVTLCSAAMPPALIFRAAGGAIEELGAGGPPIGSRLSEVWKECSAPLAPGDTLLFASDGFAEQLDPADQPLGYERMAEVFRASASMPAGELVQHLLARVATWRGEREQGDDITLVVVRATS